MNNKESISRIKSVVTSLAHCPLLVNKAQAINLLYKYDSMIASLSHQQSIEKEIEKQAAANQVKFYSFDNNDKLLSVSTASSVQVGKFAQDFESAPENSVALVPVMGAMMRDTYCTLSDGFISGTRDLESTIKQLDNNKNVSSIVFYINSAGGEARGNESLSRVIRSVKKPTVGYFEGMASAAVYAFQGVKELYAAERSSYWGSIGTYVTLVDDTEFLESMGIKLLDIYAPQSTEKNKEYRDALEGDSTALKEMLKTMTDDFISDVKKSRPELVDDGSVFKGKLYNAVQAKKINAIDGIKSLDFAIDRAAFLARKHKRDKDKKSQNSTIFNKNSELVMSDENTKKVGFFDRIFGTSKVEDAEKEIQAVEQKAQELSQEIETLNATNKEQSEKINQLIESNDKQQEKISELESAIEQNEKAVSDVLSETGFESLSDLNADYKKVLEHNKELGGAQDAATPIDNQQSTSHDREVVKKERHERSYQDIIDEMQKEEKK